MSRTVIDRTYLPPRPASGDKDLDTEFQQVCVDLVDAADTHNDVRPALVFGDVRVDLPDEMIGVLAQVAQAMSQGLAVSVVPHTMMISTQEAADMLSISRPTLVKMLVAGKIPYEQRNRHRRLFLSDVVEYRERQRRLGSEALADMVADSQSLGDYDASPSEIGTVLASVRRGE